MAGSCRRKRRKKLKKAWDEFQHEHGLSDDQLKQARSIGFTVDQLQKKISDDKFDSSMSVTSRIAEVHQNHCAQRAARGAAIEAGLIEPKKKKKKAKPPHDPRWAKAKNVCGLNMEDIRKAKALGLNPTKLINNVPGPKQRWKAPVKVWIRELYEKQQRSQQGTKRQTDHEGEVHDWERFAEPIDNCDEGDNACDRMCPRLNDADIERLAGWVNLDENGFLQTYPEADLHDLL